MSGSEVREAAIRDRLRDVVDPCSAATGSNLNVVEMGLVKGIEPDDGDVTVEMHLTTPMCHMIPYFKKEVGERVGALDGVDSVELLTDDGTEWTEAYMSEEATRKRRAVLDDQAAKCERELAAKGGDPTEGSASDA
ncbi:metal-sulfur cluster assembly factor [Halobium palmae]|uniref:Metal-sulfur cluster assembly factor n=1 Tax=Halobium palmae TaxID=1776492 RepID=A0ABD5RXA4_9EURY